MLKLLLQVLLLLFKEFQNPSPDYEGHLLTAANNEGVFVTVFAEADVAVGEKLLHFTIVGNRNPGIRRPVVKTQLGRVGLDEVCDGRRKREEEDKGKESGRGGARKWAEEGGGGRGDDGSRGGA